MPLTDAQILRFNRGAPTEGLGNLLAELEVEIEALEADVAAVVADVAALQLAETNDKHVLQVVYDFAVHGGAAGTLSLLDSAGALAILPDGAIITLVMIEILTDFDSTGATATVALSSGEDAGDLLAEDDAADLDVAIVAGAITGAGNSRKMTDDNQVVMVIGTEALIAGKFRMFIDYVVYS